MELEVAIVRLCFVSANEGLRDGGWGLMVTSRRRWLYGIRGDAFRG